jgi:hypothetical protein
MERGTKIKERGYQKATRLSESGEPKSGNVKRRINLFTKRGNVSKLGGLESGSL